MALLTVLLTLGVGGAFAILEDEAIGDGFWWAIVTITTVDGQAAVGVGRQLRFSLPGLRTRTRQRGW